MADSPDKEAIIKKEPEKPEPDPITRVSTSGILLVSALLLTAVLVWALYDEVYGQRPWKAYQREFAQRYSRYLKSIKNRARKTEAEVKETAEYQQLDAEYRAAREKVEPRKQEIDRRVQIIDEQLVPVTDAYQNVRGRITVINYEIETSSESRKDRLRKRAEAERQRQETVQIPADDGSGSTERHRLNYPQIEALYNQLKEEKAGLLSESGELLRESNELAKKRDDYLRENVVGLTPQQIDGLITKASELDVSIRQISVLEADIVDRCESCHLGLREPLELTTRNMSRPRRRPDEQARAFVSHPNKRLLDIHDPERFGCAGCHGGNGRATTSVVKGHGRHRFWLHPLYERENMEAGCQQCHVNDRVLENADVLNLGKDLFQNRGCIGCHRYEGFDREVDALANTRQTLSQLEEQINTNAVEARHSRNGIAAAASDEEAQRLLAYAESLTVTNSILAARAEQLNLQTRFLMQDQKKVGPNLKDVRLKLRKEWLPVWLRDPQAFRPGTKMPTFWRLNADTAHDPRAEEDLKAISAFLWQESFEGRMPQQVQGNAARGKELFETRGCLACHSIGGPDSEIGGDFAANLQRIGEKANFEYIVHWIYNPRERWAPYCPKHKRDLTPADYAEKGLPFQWDSEHSKCPIDGAELQVQNMTVMPNFRLSEEQARDIATYLFSLSSPPSYAGASFMDDPNLKDRGRVLIKQYGCAGCHEIKGLEDEQRIGKELTTQGATPIERLDFAMLTRNAELGLTPDGKRTKPWYNHKGFIEHKIETPWIYDQGKEKEPQDRLRMPQPFLKPEWKRALTTFLLGSVGIEGANVPSSMFYNPSPIGKDVQEGWWVVKKYNCMGCHNIEVGQKSVLSLLPAYQTPEGRDQLPPQLTTQGARVDPNWLLRFLADPSLSENNRTGPAGQAQRGTAQSGNESSRTNGGVVNGNQSRALFRPQPGQDQNGVRPYLLARMPTFNFSPNELRALVRFFMAVSGQQEPYIKQELDPLTEQERLLARALFTSQGAPCLRCHITGDPQHDRTATAPNFLMAAERLKPGWTFRWLLDPQQISPGTAMPSNLFRREGDRWVFNGPTPEAFKDYHRDHADLLVRYMLQMTPEEQRRLLATSPAPAPSSPQPQQTTRSTTPARRQVGRHSQTGRTRKGSLTSARGSPQQLGELRLWTVTGHGSRLSRE